VVPTLIGDLTVLKPANAKIDKAPAHGPPCRVGGALSICIEYSGIGFHATWLLSRLHSLPPVNDLLVSGQLNEY
jgi:hypothetical protein